MSCPTEAGTPPLLPHRQGADLGQVAPQYVERSAGLEFPVPLDDGELAYVLQHLVEGLGEHQTHAGVVIHQGMDLPSVRGAGGSQDIPIGEGPVVHRAHPLKRRGHTRLC